MNGGKPGEQRDRRRTTEDIAATAVAAVVVSVLLVEADVAIMNIMIEASQWVASPRRRRALHRPAHWMAAAARLASESRPLLPLSDVWDT